MGREKKTKTVKDVSLSELLDDFVNLDVVEDPQSVTGLTDEDYINMMLKKEAKRKITQLSQELDSSTSEKTMEKNADVEEIFESCQGCFYSTRVVRVVETLLCACTNSERELEARYSNYKWWVISQKKPRCWRSPPKSAIDAILRRRIELYSEDGQNIERREVQLDEANPIRPVAGDTKISSVSIEATELTPKTQAAVEFLRDELITSSSRRGALKTLEKYRKELPVVREKKKEKPVISEKMSPMRRCQNCYFCVAKRSFNGVYWCHCSNPGRSIEASPGISWVKSRLNLPCWKPLQD